MSTQKDQAHSLWESTLSCLSTLPPATASVNPTSSALWRSIRVHIFSSDLSTNPTVAWNEWSWGNFIPNNFWSLVFCLHWSKSKVFLRTSDAGKQCCGRVGRGAQLPSTPSPTPNALTLTDNHNGRIKIACFCTFQHDHHDGPTDGQGLL